MPGENKKIKSLKPNVQLTSNQAIHSSLSIVEEIIKKSLRFESSKDPAGPFFTKGAQSQPQQVHLRAYEGPGGAPEP